jgi:hypothetical protein
MPDPRYWELMAKCLRNNFLPMNDGAGSRLGRLAQKRWLAVAFLVSSSVLTAQELRPSSTTAALDLPDDPSASLQQQQMSPPPPPPPLDAPQAQPQTDEERRKKAQEQLEQQEKQRVMGVMATFNTTSNRDAVPLSPKQKFQLFFKSATDPWPFLLAGVVSGIGQADDSFPEYGQGMEGYGKRYGASFTDTFVGNFFGNAVLPSLWHEDPRYFQKGTGSKTKRFLWAASSTIWCRRDNGSWGPNYSNVVGNLIGSAISNVYYPQSDRTVGDTFERGFTTSAEGIVGAEVIEFWPDLVRRHQRKQAEKAARQAAQYGANPAPTSPSKPQN